MRSGRKIADNIAQAMPLLRQAAEMGADYIQTPEMSSVVERDRAALMAEITPEDRDPMLAAFRDFARKAQVHVHAGSLAVMNGDKVANRAFVIDPAGDIIARYDKVHLFDVDLIDGQSWRESNTYTGGDRAVVVDLPFGRLGLSICYDLRFAYLYRAMCDVGAHILSAPACFTKPTGEAHWTVLQRARAIECGAFMISAAQGGTHEDGRETFGHSIIIDPWGRVLAEAGDEPGVIAAKVDLALGEDIRRRIPALKHTRSVPVVAGTATPSRVAAE
jgi:predicted amidohydrolase